MLILTQTNSQTKEVAILDTDDNTLGWVSFVSIAKSLTSGKIQKIYGIPLIEKARNDGFTHRYPSLGVAIDEQESLLAQQQYMRTKPKKPTRKN